MIYAAMQVPAGASELVLAGGAESMSNAAFYSTSMRWGAKNGPGVMLHDALSRGRLTAGGKHHPVPGGMLETAENLRREDTAEVLTEVLGLDDAEIERLVSAGLIGPTPRSEPAQLTTTRLRGGG